MTEVLLHITPVGQGFGRTQLLRVEPLVVVSNRTGVPMQLLQCRVRHAREEERAVAQRAERAAAEGAAIAAAAQAVRQYAQYVYKEGMGFVCCMGFFSHMNCCAAVY